MSSSVRHSAIATDAPDVNGHFGTAHDNSPQHPVANKSTAQPLVVSTYDIHQILRPGRTPLRIGDLLWLIASQARLHGCDSVKDEKALTDYMRKHESTFRGFVLHAAGKTPVAYAVYYQTVDEKGNKVAYCEDFFINDSFRNQGVANILFQELAQRTLDDKCHYLQWATDGRNQQVVDFASKKLGAKTPEQIGKITISANELIDKDHRDQVFAPLRSPFKNAYEIRRIAHNDITDLQSVGLNSDLVNATGGLPFTGYIVHKKNSKHDILAVIPGWIHFSTFQLKEGIHFEHPSFAPGLSDVEKTDIVLSVLDTATNFKARGDTKPHYNHVRWHIKQDDEFLTNLLQQNLGLKVDTMTDDPESHLKVFQLQNGSLAKIATSNPSRVVRDNVSFAYHPHHTPANSSAPIPPEIT